jgi:hypothetical protein
MKDQYIGIIEIQDIQGDFHAFTILKDNQGYKAVSPTNNGYFTKLKGFETLEALYEALGEMLDNGN